MTGTSFAFPAYHETMEILIVLFMLALAEKNSDLKESLQSVLKFYRENRELIMAFAGGVEAPSAQPAAAESVSAKAPLEPEKIRILEDFLKRH